MRSGTEIFRRAMRADPERRVALLEAAVAADDIAWDSAPPIHDVWEELADAYATAGHPELAIRAMERAVELGWTGKPDHRVKLAEFTLLSGRVSAAESLLEAARAADPDEIWLYNAAGMMYADNALHAEAATWLARGIGVALQQGGQDDVLEQLVELRAESLFQLGERPDALQLEAVDRLNARSNAPDGPPPDWPLGPRRSTIVLAFFPASELAQAMARWPELDEPSWEAYVHRLEGTAKRFVELGGNISGFAPIHVNRFIAWCVEEGIDPADAASRAAFAVRAGVSGEIVAWPPARSERCWCGSGRSYRRCCADVPPAEMA
jgi:tetratricopeptide (TPR) repeat protein